jgi:hypothetical protein
MSDFRLWAACGACVVALACSSADSSTGRAGGNVASPNGPVGAPAKAPVGGTPSTFGNSNSPAQVAAMQPAAQQKPTPMAGGLAPMSVDACGANNAAGLSAADAAKLMAGGGGASGMRWLYPYDGTVFPRGLLPPMLMWDGGPADAVYVHIQASLFEYKGCLKPTADGQVQLPADVWATAGQQTKGGSDPYLLELSVIKGGMVKGPVAEHVTIAQATIKGSIYYNSYSSKLAAAAAPMGGGGGVPGLFGGGGPGMGSSGAVLRIPPGGMAEVFTSTECNGCHSVSANGSRMLSQAIGAGRSYMLAQNGATNPMPINVSGSDAFGALYPDGSVYLAESLVIDIGRSTYTAGNVTSMDATLYHTSDGTVVPNTGIPVGALMPMFSPDGSLLVFNDYAINQAHGLAVMSYDVTTNTATGYRMLFTDTNMRPGWPFVLPDNGAVVFTRTDGMDFSGEGAGIAAGMQVQVTGATTPPVSDVHMVDLKTGTITILARAMGYDTPDDAKAGKTYLPFGAEELHMSYFPTLSPVAAGGYFWIFFDAVRHYGNQGQQRQIWGAAIDIAADGSYSVDRSHPAYYLPGQEFGTGNHRAFAALDPCKMNGDSCTSGTDCCGGFCYVKMPSGEFMSEPVGSCTDNTPMCANTNDRCKTNADCCPPGPGDPPKSCIAGFCAVVRPPS